MFQGGTYIRSARDFYTLVAPLSSPICCCSSGTNPFTAVALLLAFAIQVLSTIGIVHAQSKPSLRKSKDWWYAPDITSLGQTKVEFPQVTWGILLGLPVRHLVLLTKSTLV